ncbi:hypothetical protein N7495_009880 [Penicillium taxi]|uniref:uncharacterized protein n=1 Tax=Penicillium taxi TaxID=168475 RepID=UPI00254535B6|nr:uncharacterized protein N7495_009880 [Penicillium taxi]KAJ5885370.1 hypothetical protein N7495_009880 [Penicillium taxi]
MSDREFNATVQKIISEILPSNGQTFSKEARDLLMECCVEFITLISSEANDISEKEAKKTIACEHVEKALHELGFSEFVGPVLATVDEHKEQLKSREKKQSKMEQSGLSEAELMRQQEELFRSATEKYNAVPESKLFVTIPDWEWRAEKEAGKAKAAAEAVVKEAEEEQLQKQKVDEHILLIAPGSQMTLAQLGLPEQFTPAQFRFPTRMFPAQNAGEFEPYKVRERRREVNSNNGTDAPKELPKRVETKDAGEAANGSSAEKTEKSNEPAVEDSKVVENPEATQAAPEILYEEDVTSEEGAIYPIENGRIVNWPCFFALLTHVYNALSPHLHTPILMIAEPVWSRSDREAIVQFVFEKFKVPAFSLLDSAVATCLAYAVQTALVVDVGKGKTDITAVTEFEVNPHGRGVALKGCGGDAMTDRLVELLGPKGFTREMCDQLKRSNISEILPPGTPLPGSSTTARQSVNPAAAASTGVPEANPLAPRGPGEGTQTGTDTNGDEDEGVLDVAAIVSGNTTEYLANMEKEKSSNKKAAPDPKQPRLPNSKKDKASFQFEDFKQMEGEDTSGGPTRYIRHSREIEVGIERFLLATPPQNDGDPLLGGIIEYIATQIYHTIASVPDPTKRGELWDSIIIVGYGSKVRGFVQSLLGVITQKYVLSPSASMFTSEIPSAFSTPIPSGTNTPAPQLQMFHPTAPGVNPLLVAATHNQPGMAMPPSMDPSMVSHYRSTGHSQNPHSVKTLRLPDYFPEFKDLGNINTPGVSTGPNGQSQSGHGYEEAVFLGAQLGAKAVFVLDQGVTKGGYMSRIEYNESGPSAIHECSW